ncbi:MAG: AMP-binding protein [Bacteroidota bacterium]
MKMSQLDWVAKWAVYSPQSIVANELESRRAWTYQELDQKATAFVHWVRDRWQLKLGDRIAVLAENCLEYYLLFVAAQRAGYILAPLNYRLTASELDYLLQDADPQLLIYSQAFAPKVAAIPSASSIKGRLELENLLAALDGVIKQPLEPVNISETAPVFILYTSGTTGFPKGVCYTHEMLFWNSVNTSLSLVINSDSRTVNCMPPFHTGGWNVLSTPFIHHGAFSCIAKKFDADQILQSLETERVTIFMGVPTMLKMMADSPLFVSVDLSALLYIIVGGEAMPVPLIERWHAKGVPIRQGYGMTEVGPNLTSLHQRDAVKKAGSIGRPNFYTQARIVDKSGQDVEVGDAGELWLGGILVTPGYWRQPEATARTIQDGWLRTGDRVRADEEGYLYIVDRIKNMYISGGENVYPAEVERVLLQHAAVAEVAVVACPDERWGEVGRAYVVLATTTASVERQLRDHCRAQLAKFKVPKYYVFLEELPKNDSGKIDRKKLKAP